MTQKTWLETKFDLRRYLRHQQRDDHNTIRELIQNATHPKHQNKVTPEEFQRQLEREFRNPTGRLLKVAQAEAEWDPTGKILTSPPFLDTKYFSASNITSIAQESDKYEIVHSVLSDRDDRTERLLFNPAQYPIWEDQLSHPVRSGEGFDEFGVPMITTTPYDQFILQFTPPIKMPLNELGKDLIPGTMHIMGAIYKDIVKHTLIGVGADYNPTTYRILQPETGRWQVLPPLGTDPRLDGYSTIQNDSILLGYLHWFGCVLSDNDELVQVEHGNFFDLNTGSSWISLAELSQSHNFQLSELSSLARENARKVMDNTSDPAWDDYAEICIEEAERNDIRPLLAALGIPPKMAHLYLIPVGSGIAGIDISSEWNEERTLSLGESLTLKQTDIFMHCMDYLLGTREEWETIGVGRMEKKRLQKAEKPIPPPWRRVKYTPPTGKQTLGPRSSNGTGTKSQYSWKRRRHKALRWVGGRQGFCDRVLIEMGKEPLLEYICDPLKGKGMGVVCPNHRPGINTKKVIVKPSIFNKGKPYIPRTDVIEEQEE